MVVVAVAACGGAQKPPAPAGETAVITPSEGSSAGLQLNAQQRAVKARLDSHLAGDANAEACVEIAKQMQAGNSFAIEPFFSLTAFRERLLERGALQPQYAEVWARKPEHFRNVAQVQAVPGAQFECLGTRVMDGENIVVIRLMVGAEANVNYIALHMSPDGRSIDDYLIAGTGVWASATNHFLMASGQSAEAIIKKKADLDASNRLYLASDFAGLIAHYDGLPAELQSNAVLFAKYFQAVLRVEQPGSDRRKAAVATMDQVLTSPLTQALLKTGLALQAGDTTTAMQHQTKLVEMVDDYMLLRNN